MTDSTTEENELDSWAEAMAEQEAATQESTENDVETNAAEEVTPAESGPAEKKPDTEETGFPGAQTTSASVFKELSGNEILRNAPNDIDLILDIPVQLTVELGRTKIAIKNLLQLAQGSVVELDGLAGEPMDVLVNGCLIAQGEVVVVNDKFGIRLTDIITPSERIRKLNR